MTREDSPAYVEAHRTDKSRLKDYDAPHLVLENPVFTPRPFVGRLASLQRDAPPFDESARTRIAHGNALRLNPRFAS